MITTRLSGGLGNQMFQYAAGRALALSRSTDLALDLSWFQRATQKQVRTKRSYELYARYVIPHFQGVNRTRYWSYQWVTDHTKSLTEMRTAAAQAMFDVLKESDKP